MNADLFVGVFEQEINRNALAVEIEWFKPHRRHMYSGNRIGVRLVADIGLIVASEATVNFDELHDGTAQIIAESMVSDVRLGILTELCDEELKRRKQ